MPLKSRHWVRLVWKKCTLSIGKVMNSDFAHFLEDGTKLKILFKIKPSLISISEEKLMCKSSNVHHRNLALQKNVQISNV